MERWLKSEPLPLLQEVSTCEINADEGMIPNVIMAQAGPAKGHGVHLEQEMIARLVEYDQKHFSETGLKARFGHPSLSDTTMGRQMGYFRNFRLDGDKAVADLYLLDSADLSPTQPGMKAWMLKMSYEAPDFVMSSIVFAPSGYYQYDPETGERVDLGGEPQAKYDNERIFVDFNEEKGARHYYTDIVEAGAATERLYSQQFNRDKFAVRTVAWLQENPDILHFIQANPHKIVEMCERLNIQLPVMDEKKNLWNRLGTLLFGEGHTDEAPEAYRRAGRRE